MPNPHLCQGCQHPAAVHTDTRPVPGSCRHCSCDGWKPRVRKELPWISHYEFAVTYKAVQSAVNSVVREVGRPALHEWIEHDPMNERMRYVLEWS